MSPDDHDGGDRSQNLQIYKSWTPIYLITHATPIEHTLLLGPETLPRSKQYYNAYLICRHFEYCTRGASGCDLLNKGNVNMLRLAYELRYCRMFKFKLSETVQRATAHLGISDSRAREYVAHALAGGWIAAASSGSI